MCRAPFTRVLMAALLGAASTAPVHKATAASAILPSVPNPDKPITPERRKLDKAARSNAVLTPEHNPAPGHMIASAYRDIDRIASNQPKPPTNPAAQDNSGWRYTAALLGTLAILATIAVRRRKAGTPWT